MDEYFDDEARILDFAVRSLARGATVTMEELAAAEAAAVVALNELEPALAGKATPSIIREKHADIRQVTEALRQSTDPAQSALYAGSAEKLGAGRQYSATVVTVAASAALIICALRLGTIELGKDGKGLSIRFNSNKEPFSSSMKAVADLVKKLFSGPGSTDRAEGDQ